MFVLTITKTGGVPDNKATIKSLIKVMPDKLSLVWKHHLECEQDTYCESMHLTETPEGEYYLWQGTWGFQLIVMADFWVVEGTLIQRAKVNEGTVPEQTLAQFRKALLGSGVRIAVYGDPRFNTAWQYQMVKEDQTTPQRLGRQPFIGTVNLNTGKVT